MPRTRTPGRQLQQLDRRRLRHVLIACCGAHVIQDGLTALKYVLLPILAHTFGLSYTQVGLLRGISALAMSGLEVPAGIWAERFGERRLLAAGLVGAGLGYLGVAFASGFALIALAFLVAGLGAAFQHSLASSTLVRSFDGPARRRALGSYNSAGDAGKLTFTGVFSAAVGAGLAWNAVVVLLALIAIAFGAVTWRLLGSSDPMVSASSMHAAAPTSNPIARSKDWGVKSPRRFALLGTMVFLDSVVQAVFLTFIAFVLLDRGSSQAVASIAVVLVLAGGMVGKFACGFMAARLGDRSTFQIVQLLSVAGIAATVVLPGLALLFALPLIGLVVQGSSTVTYGSVADFVAEGRQSRGYAVIYTLASASSVVGPFAFGLLADSIDLSSAIWALAVVTAATLPFSMVLSGPLRTHGSVVQH